MLEITEADIDALESELKGIIFDNIRRNVLIDNTSFDLQACPGSGKTTLLAAKLMILSKKWQWSNKGVCVLSHTNVAKDEIIGRLKKHSTGWHFLEYPHFIGTIQEFVNKFLAIPFIRNINLPIKSIDNDIYLKKCSSRLSNRTKAYLGKKFCSLLDLMLIWDGKKLAPNIPGFSKPSTSDSYKNLCDTKKYLLKSGYFQFREMYDFAEASLTNSNFLKKALQTRFKMVFIDEMQDTQKHQDEIIEKIFPRKSNDPSVQRFGDSDQAIFDGMDDEPNDSFYGDACKYRINDSHRFSPCIANLLKGLSFSKLELKSSYECKNQGRHTECKNFGNNLIYVYDNQAEAKLIPQIYSTHVTRVFEGKSKIDLKVIAVGAIGKKSEKDSHVHIDNYYTNFTKAKQPSALKFDCLYECVAFAAQQRNPNIKENYDLFINCLLNHLYGLKVEITLENKQNNLNKTNFLFALKQNKENLRVFNKIIGNWSLAKTLPLRQDWESATQNLLNVLGHIFANNLQELSSPKFWAYPSKEYLDKYRDTENFNTVGPLNGISVAFNTIHGAKGQTHDAKLVL